MAIGDAVAAFLGTAATNRQPSSGVEEQIGAIVKDDTTDTIHVYNGSTALRIFIAGVQTNAAHDDATATRAQPLNSSIMIDNSIYMRKTGTSAYIYVGGVQVNA